MDVDSDDYPMEDICQKLVDMQIKESRIWHLYIGYLYQWQPNLGVNHTDLSGKKIYLWFNEKYIVDFVNATNKYNSDNPEYTVAFAPCGRIGFYNYSYEVVASW